LEKVVGGPTPPSTTIRTWLCKAKRFKGIMDLFGALSLVWKGSI